MFVGRISDAVTPSLAHVHSKPETQRRYMNLTVKVLSLLVILAAMGNLFFNKDFMQLWVGEHYFGGENLNIFLSLLAMLAVINATLQNNLFVMGQVETISRIAIGETLLRLLAIVIILQFSSAVINLVILSCLTAAFPKLFFLARTYSPLAREHKSTVRRNLSIAMILLAASAVAGITIKVLPLQNNYLTFIIKCAAFIVLGISTIFVIDNELRQEAFRGLQHFIRRPMPLSR